MPPKYTTRARFRTIECLDLYVTPRLFRRLSGIHYVRPLKGYK